MLLASPKCLQVEGYTKEISEVCFNQVCDKRVERLGPEDGELLEEESRGLEE